MSKTPFCEKCNEWYLNPIKGNYPSEIAPGLTDALETGDPRNIPTFQPMLPNAKDPHITIELQKCACEQGDFRLATSLHWRESKNKDGQVKVEDKGEVWFATMISPGFGRQLGARLFHMSSQPANPDATAKASLPVPISESAPTEPSADTVAEKSKKCPICDNEINADARLCNCCGAAFEISVQGYCATCHQIRDTDANNCCHICGTSLVDIHTTSEYVTPDSQINRASIPGNLSTAQSVQTNKKNIGSTWARVAGISLVLVGACLFIFKSLQFNIPLFTATATETPRPTQTHIPTPRATATRTQLPTSTPLPIEIIFDDIGNYPVGRSVILVGRLALMSSTTCSLGECCLILENPASPSQTLPIFVPVGSRTNQMKPLPDQYTKSDIQVQLDDGTFAVIGYRIRVTGRVCATTAKEPCISDITKIELFQLK